MQQNRQSVPEYIGWYKYGYNTDILCVTLSFHYFLCSHCVLTGGRIIFEIPVKEGIN